MNAMPEVMSEDVLEWARDLAAIRDLLSGHRAGLRQAYGVRGDGAVSTSAGVVVRIPPRRLRADPAA